MIARGGLVVAALLLLRAAEAAPPKVIEIDVPQPSRPPPPPPSGGNGAPGEDGVLLPDGTVVTSEAGGGGRRVRRGPREVKGEAPAALWGRYEIVQITAEEETEDFRIKMEREGKALDQDCITVRRVLDFGPTSDTPALPTSVTISEQQRCHKGGLGTYAHELDITLPAQWTPVTGDSGIGLALELPPVEAMATLVRVRSPDNSEMSTPLHWLGPESKIERQKSRFEVFAELPRRAEEAPLAIHLVGKGTTFHLEPEPQDGPFGP